MRFASDLGQEIHLPPSFFAKSALTRSPRWPPRRCARRRESLSRWTRQSRRSAQPYASIACLRRLGQGHADPDRSDAVQAEPRVGGELTVGEGGSRLHRGREGDGRGRGRRCRGGRTASPLGCWITVPASAARAGGEEEHGQDTDQLRSRVSARLGGSVKGLVLVHRTHGDTPRGSRTASLTQRRESRHSRRQRLLSAILDR